MKFITFVDLTEKLRMQKLLSYDHFKKRHFYSLCFNEPA